MADQVVDNLLIELKIKMTALEQGLAAAGQRIDEFTSETKDAAKQQSAAVKSSTQDQAASYAMASAAATAAFAVIVSAIKSGVDAANQYTSALTGLRSITEGTGQNFGTIQQALNGLTADGLIPVSDAATALKNLLSRGFDAQQAIDMLNRLKDSAAFSRQSTLTLGEAVRGASEGIRNENSLMVDNAGVTKNVAKMWEDYAKQIGKSTNDLTLAEKRQAEYNGIMQETRFQVGDAQKYAATFAGTQAELSAATLKAEQAFGNAAQRGLQPFLEALTPVAQGIASYVQQNPSFVAAITTGGTTVLGFVSILSLARTVINFFKTSLAGMGAALGWAGVIAAVISLFVGIASAADQAAEASAKAASDIRDSINSTKQEQSTLRDYQELVASGKATHEELAAAREKIIQQSPELVAGYDAEGNAIMGDSEAIEKKVQQLQEYIDMQKEAMRAAADNTLADAAAKQSQAIADQKKVMAEYNAELANIDKWRTWKAAMENAGAKEMQFDGVLYSLQTVQSYIDGAVSRLDGYKKAWADARKEQEQAVQEATATNQVLFQDHIDMLGQLNTVQQFVAQETLQFALQEQMSEQEFIALLANRLNSMGYMIQAEQRQKQAALENSEAVKQWGDQEKSLDNIRKANTALAEAKKIKQYTDTVKAGQTGTKEYKEAMAGLVKEYGASDDAIASNINAYADLANQGLAGATNAQELLRASLQKAIVDLKATGLEGEYAASKLEPLLKIFDSLGAGDDTTKKGGGGAARKKPWEEELDMIDRVAKAGDEYAQQYLDHIDELLANEKLSAKERERLEKERGYAVLQVNDELEQAHIAYLERLLRREKLTADQRLDVEEKLFEAERDLMAKYQDLASKISSAYQAKLEAMRDAELQSIQDSISAVSEWQQAQTDAVRAAADAQIDAINEQIAALDALYKAQTREDQDAQDADKLARLQQQLAYEKDGQNRKKILEQIINLEASAKKRHDQEQLADQKDALKAQITAIQNSADEQTKAIEAQAKAETAALNARLTYAQNYWTQRLQLENVQQEALAFMLAASEDEIIALLKEYEPEYFDASKALGQAAYKAIKPKMDDIISAAENMASSVVSAASRAAAALRELEGTNAKINALGKGTTGSSGASVNVASYAARVQRTITGVQRFAANPGASIAGMYDRAQRAVDGVVYRSMQPAAQQMQEVLGRTGGQRAQTKVVKVDQTVIMQQPVPTPSQNARALRREAERLANMLTRR